jgi:uncharacterized membrane protein
MTAVALALHIFGAVVWVGGMFAIYVCLRPALGTLEPPQRLRLMRVTFEKFFPLNGDGLRLKQLAMGQQYSHFLTA